MQSRLEVAVRSILAPREGGRSNNEDNYLLIGPDGIARYLKDEREIQQQVPNWPAGHSRLAILDGMGGHSYGREAAERTVAGILEIAATSRLEVLNQQLDTLHRQLHRQMHVNGAEPGCTLTLLEIPVASPALLFHVGDSRLYAIDKAKAEFLTVDHIPATKLALLNYIDQKEWFRQTHEFSTPQISQAFVLGNGLGVGTTDLFSNELEVNLQALTDQELPIYLRGLGDRREVNLQRGRLYLLASDGFWHLPRPQEFIQLWPQLLLQPQRSLSELLDNLLAELIRQTLRDPHTRGDNSTAILFRLP